MDISEDKYYFYKGRRIKGDVLAKMAWNSKHTNQVGGQSANLIKALDSSYENTSPTTETPAQKAMREAKERAQGGKK